MQVSLQAELSLDESLSAVLLDRGDQVKAEWIAAGRSTATSHDDKQKFNSFDYIDQSAWLEIIQPETM